MRNFALVAIAVLLALPVAQATAGRVHPELEARLARAFPNDRIAVIVRMREQANPRSIVSTLPQKAARKLRRKALVDALRDQASGGHARLRAEIAGDELAGEVERVIPFWVFNGMALHASERVIRRLAAREDVLEVRLDSPVPPPPSPTSVDTPAGPAEWNIALVRAPEVWAMDPAYNGSGVVVGSFDSGVDITHPDLFSRYRGDHAISWFDPYQQHGLPFDANGHGTHTTSTAVGGNASGTHIGVAPGAKWIAARGWNDSGSGTLSAFHQVFQWFLAPGDDPANAPDVVNNSWALIIAGCDPEFLPDIMAWRAAGIFPAFAAGNSGPFDSSVRSPGALVEAFAVGATDVFDEIATFSSRGPSPCSGVTKPDISAPGSNVRAAIPGGYAAMSGTSMATPHITGAVALLLSIKPALTVEELATILTRSASDLGPEGADNTYGTGRLDLAVAAEMALRGFDVPLVRASVTGSTVSENSTTPALVTFSRSGSIEQPLELKLTVEGTATAGVDYVPVPGSVTIPAGAASATISVLALDDTELEVNESLLVTIAPDPAYIVSWSRTASIIIASDEQFPDLTVSALTVPSVAGSGEAISVTDTATNRGGGPAAASVTRYFLSSNSVFEPSDTDLGSRDVPVLAPGASHAGTTTLTLPTAATGTWYVLAVADASNSLPETSDANNSASRVVRVGPDLDVLSVALPSASGAGLSFTASDSVKNAGGGASAASVTHYYLSFNGTLEINDDVLLGRREVSALAPGQTSVGTTTLTVPDGIATGNWYVIAVADGGGSIAETVEGNNTLVQTLRIGPDLDVTALTLPTGAGAGETITATDTVRNQGGGMAAASATHYFLSSNLTLDGADTPIGSRSLPALEAGASNNGSVMLSIPSDQAAGTWYVIAVSDGANEVPETSEINNTFVLSIQIGPDLDITALSVPASAGAGGAITVTDTTKNRGAGQAPASVTRYVLSTDTVVGGDIPLGAREVPALAADASDTGSAALTLPDDTPTGSYYIIAVADGDGAIGETYETNNIQAMGIRVGADLVVSSMSGPSVIGAGQSMTVSETTKNQGGGSAAATLTRYFLSADSLFDASDEPLNARDVPVLAAGQSSIASVSLAIPAGTGSGTWYVIAVADAGQALSETYETNNTRALALRIGPDLVIGALSGPSAAVAGQSITLADTVRNSGAGGAAASTTRFYLSTNTTLDDDDEPLGARGVPALAAGASHSGSTVVTIPAGTAVGSWSVIAVADGDGVVVETSETNNRSTLTVRVGADLSVYSLSAPAFAAAGQGIAVTDTTRNLAATPAPASVTQYFLSTNTTLETGDTPLGSRDVPGLGANASSAGSATVTIPAGTAPGAYFLLARADATAAVEEVSETNNVLSRSISIGPDLVVSSFTVPGSATAGQTIGIAETTRNQGTAPAGPTVTRYYLSTNSSLDANDELLGTREVPALGAGASSLSGTLTLALPPDIAGTRYVIARTDALEAVDEANEKNNTFARSIWVTAP